jgi:hypothetical protein
LVAFFLPSSQETEGGGKNRCGQQPATVEGAAVTGDGGPIGLYMLSIIT